MDILLVYLFVYSNFIIHFLKLMYDSSRYALWSNLPLQSYVLYVDESGIGKCSTTLISGTTFPKLYKQYEYSLKKMYIFFFCRLSFFSLTHRSNLILNMLVLILGFKIMKEKLKC